MSEVDKFLKQNHIVTKFIKENAAHVRLPKHTNTSGQEQLRDAIFAKLRSLGLEVYKNEKTFMYIAYAPTRVRFLLQGISLVDYLKDASYSLGEAKLQQVKWGAAPATLKAANKTLYQDYLEECNKNPLNPESEPAETRSFANPKTYDVSPSLFHDIQGYTFLCGEYAAKRFTQANATSVTHQPLTDALQLQLQQYVIDSIAEESCQRKMTLSHLLDIDDKIYNKIPKDVTDARPAKKGRALRDSIVQAIAADRAKKTPQWANGHQIMDERDTLLVALDASRTCRGFLIVSFESSDTIYIDALCACAGLNLGKYLFAFLYQLYGPEVNYLLDALTHVMGYYAKPELGYKFGSCTAPVAQAVHDDILQHLKKTNAAGQQVKLDYDDIFKEDGGYKPLTPNLRHAFGTIFQHNLAHAQNGKFRLCPLNNPAHPLTREQVDRMMHFTVNREVGTCLDAGVVMCKRGTAKTGPRKARHTAKGVRVPTLRHRPSVTARRDIRPYRRGAIKPVKNRTLMRRIRGAVSPTRVSPRVTRVSPRVSPQEVIDISDSEPEVIDISDSDEPEVIDLRDSE